MFKMWVVIMLLSLVHNQDLALDPSSNLLLLLFLFLLSGYVYALFSVPSALIDLHFFSYIAIFFCFTSFFPFKGFVYLYLFFLIISIFNNHLS